MAIEFFSESSNMSPRISFSHDFSQCEVVPVEQQHHHPLRSNSTGIDFNFCVRESFESSSADELFSDGKILPTQVKKKKKKPVPGALPSSSPLPQALHSNSNGDTNEKTSNKESSKETKIIRDETGDDEAEDMKQTGSSSSKSFWGFKRSSSLNCGSAYGRSLCPLPLLSRSNSTGSTPNENNKKDSQGQKHYVSSQKQAAFKGSSQFSSSSSSSSSSSTIYHKPPLKKTYGSYGSGSVRINPVLNVPSGNLFGLGSFFSNGSKDKNKRK